MMRKTADQVLAELKKSGMAEESIQRILPHKVVPCFSVEGDTKQLFELPLLAARYNVWFVVGNILTRKTVFGTALRKHLCLVQLQLLQYSNYGNVRIFCFRI